jgi:hypothetical protein
VRGVAEVLSWRSLAEDSKVSTGSESISDQKRNKKQKKKKKLSKLSAKKTKN